MTDAEKEMLECLTAAARINVALLAAAVHHAHDGRAGVEPTRRELENAYRETVALKERLEVSFSVVAQSTPAECKLERLSMLPVRCELNEKGYDAIRAHRQKNHKLRLPLLSLHGGAEGIVLERFSSRFVIVRWDALLDHKYTVDIDEIDLI